MRRGCCYPHYSHTANPAGLFAYAKTREDPARNGGNLFACKFLKIPK